MKHVLLVDDDPLILRMYGRGLSLKGYQVSTAPDGLEAVKWLQQNKPDVIILDLMMPKFSGTDVLKFLREKPESTRIPVIVLTNAYLDEMSREAAASGAKKILLKVRCSPLLLVGAIEQVLAGGPEAEPSGQTETRAWSPIPMSSPPPKKPALRPRPPVQPEPAPILHEKQRETEFRTQARQEFLTTSASACANLRALLQAFKEARPEERDLRLQALYRKVHFLSDSAGLAERFAIAQMTTAFEAMLFQMMEGPDKVTPSVLRTADDAISFLQVLFQHTSDSEPDGALQGRVLVVDPDPLSTRLVVTALLRAQLEAHSTGDCKRALECLKQRPHDLPLVETEMPGTSGFDFCKEVRALPGYEQIPVIYLTTNRNFETCARSLISGAGDLIPKPILAMELAVKAVIHLLRQRLPKSQTAQTAAPGSAAPAG